MNFRNNHLAFRGSESPAQQRADLSRVKGLHRTRSIQPGRQGKSRNRGFTLVELMVAMTIGLIILAAVAKIFATSRSTYVLEEGIARVQESGRFGTEFITTDVRMAGYLGCANSNTTTVQNMLNSPTDYGTNYAPGQYIYGHAYTGSGGLPTALTDWTPALPAAFFSSGDVEPYTDVLVVRRADSSGFTVTLPLMTTTASALQIDTGNGLSVGDIVLVSDCTSADIFQITGPTNPSISGTLNHNSGAGTPGNASPANLSKKYGTDAQLMKIITRAYYIGKRGNVASNPPALFRKELGTSGAISTQELVEGIERMKVVYGVNTDTTSDNTANIYQSASAVNAGGNWSKVVSARVGLLVRTLSNVDQTLDTKLYSLAGLSSLPAFNDQLRRQVYNTTIRLRN